MLNDRGSSWNPNVVGPLDRCPRCWAPVAQDFAYCYTCGKTSLVFKSLPVEHRGQCYRDGTHPAEWTCCLCRQPICRQCCARETNPFTGAGPLWHCRQCVDAASAIETTFFALLSATRCCSKHRDIPAAFACKDCKLPLCLSCAYFTSKGILARKVGDGPYCLGCFRTFTVMHRRRRWFSGHDVAHALL